MSRLLTVNRGATQKQPGESSWETRSAKTGGTTAGLRRTEGEEKGERGRQPARLEEESEGPGGLTGPEQLPGSEGKSGGGGHTRKLHRFILKGAFNMKLNRCRSACSRGLPPARRGPAKSRCWRRVRRTPRPRRAGPLGRKAAGPAGARRARSPGAAHGTPPPHLLLGPRSHNGSRPSRLLVA